MRLCLEARKINEMMINDNELAETLEVLFRRCSEVKVMSSLDLLSSFWQIN